MVHIPRDHAEPFSRHHEPANVTGHDDIDESGGLDSDGHHYHATK